MLRINSMEFHWFEWERIDYDKAFKGLLDFLVEAIDEKETFLGMKASGWHELIIQETPIEFCDEVSQEGKEYYSTRDFSRQGKILVSLVNRDEKIKKRLLDIIEEQYELFDDPDTFDVSFFAYGDLKEWIEVEPALI